MSRTILLADDSVTIQKVIELTFMDEDYEVVAVGNGDDALEKLGQITPDFVIADVHMPGADGYDVAKQSKSLRPEVPVLLLVSTFEPFDEDEARKSGCDAFLKKPFDSQELQQLVERLSAEAAGEATAEEAPAWQPAAPEEPPLAGEAGETEAPPAGEEASRPAAPFSIGLDDEDEAPPSQVSPPGEAPAGPRPAGFGEQGGATEAEPEVFELEPEELGAPESPSRPAPEAGAGEGRAEPPAAPGAEAPRPEAPQGPPLRVESPLSDEDVDRIARRIVELLGDKPVRDVAWEVVPDMAEVVIRGRIRELESQVESVE